MTTLSERQKGDKDTQIEKIQPIEVQPEWVQKKNVLYKISNLGMWWKIKNLSSSDFYKNDQLKQMNTIDITPQSENYAIQNLRMNGNPKLIKQVAVVIGGQEFERIQPSLEESFRPFTLFEKPFLCPAYHTITLRIKPVSQNETQEEFWIDQDLLTVNPTIHSIEVPFNQAFLQNLTMDKNGKKKTDLRFQQDYQSLLKMIEIQSQDYLFDIILQLDNTSLSIPFQKKTDKHFVFSLKFDTPINLRNVKDLSLKVNGQPWNKYSMIFTSVEVARCISGMASISQN